MTSEMIGPADSAKSSSFAFVWPVAGAARQVR
jgi:hypothetical protein